MPGFFAIAMGDNALLLPAGYQSNAPIRAYTDFVGAPGFTLNSLGIDVGTSHFALVNGDHVTVEVAPVPLPATAPLLAAGMLGLTALANREALAPNPSGLIKSSRTAARSASWSCPRWWCSLPVASAAACAD